MCRVLVCLVLPQASLIARRASPPHENIENQIRINRSRVNCLPFVIPFKIRHQFMQIFSCVYATKEFFYCVCVVCGLWCGFKFFLSTGGCDFLDYFLLIANLFSPKIYYSFSLFLSSANAPHFFLYIIVGTLLLYAYANSYM